MSNLDRFENLKQIVRIVEPQFDELAKIHNAVHYKREASFAIQALTDNKYLAQVAFENQDSLKRAIINVAAIGLSLNPYEKLAYLVPRDGKVMLDISYRGYVQLAIDIGAIMWAKAELVFEKDEFLYQGMNESPIHKFNPFAKDRGQMLGGYVLAKSHDDTHYFSFMTINDVFNIRDRSQSFIAFKAGKAKSSPWSTDESEMIKKTLIKRAAKGWAMRDSRESARFNRAIDITNDLDLNAPAELPPAEKDNRTESFEMIRDGLKKLDRTEEQYIAHLCRVNRREIKSLEDLTEHEIFQALVMLNQLIEAKEKKAKEGTNENAS